MLKVNDKVKIIGVNTWGANNYIGYEGKVNKLNGGFAHDKILVKDIKMKTGNKESWFYKSSLEKIEPETQFKVGDAVEIVGKAPVYGKMFFGKTGIIIEIDKYGGNCKNLVEFNKTLGGKLWYPDSSLKLVTPKKEETMKEPVTPATFYCCYVDGTGGFSYQHPTSEEAEQEAERLANQSKNIGKKVHVMKEISYCIVNKNPVEWNK